MPSTVDDLVRIPSLSPDGPGALRHLQDELSELERAGLLRTPAVASAPAGMLVLCSNDYLGYADLPWSPGGDAASGAGASRLVSGTHEAHLMAERELASWLGTESALLFSSGYAANVGTLAALARPGDVIVSDALNHASIIDGCRLSRAAVEVVRHCDLPSVEEALVRAAGARRRWVVTESLFSMDGDTPDLRALRALCDRHDAALIVDEAHALGVCGPRGAGLCAATGVRPDVFVGTLGKSLGLHGAFVAGSSTLRTYLWNRARSFVFSTGISPMLALATVDRVRRAAADDAGRARLAMVTAQLRSGLRSLGARLLPASSGPILPWILESPAAAVEMSQRLAREGILVQAIRPPTVPAGTSRLRITSSASLSEADVERALAGFREAVR
ncbi:aminotransferase class I/II-fold pyridoxal phosphate-dependent enzyme [Sorangium sp. So ce1335]|uniref:aminotransferase class I/II-fold pyridoxal phosphate-dependent enzyme n=1 Tax=Sorangium sp. So ce1335 TaxID=3133335 RepID=UPI003F5F7F67